MGDGQDLDAWMAPALDLSIGGIKGSNLSAAILGKDVFQLSAFIGIPIHGLIGYDFFKSFPVKINFADSTLTAFNSKKIRGWQKSCYVALDVQDNKPYVSANINFADDGALPVKLIVDLGASHALSIENGWDNDGGMPQKYLAEANLGVGLNGAISGYMSRINVIRIGNYQFRQIIAAFP